MHSFKDSKGNSWEIVIDPFTIAKVNDRLGVSLYDLSEAVQQLYSDPPKLVHALYLLCFDQTEREGVGERDFCRGFSGDSLDRARKAFEDELVFFSPSPAQPTLRRALVLQKEVAEKAILKLRNRAEAKLAAVDVDDMAAKLAERLEKAAG